MKKTFYCVSLLLLTGILFAPESYADLAQATETVVEGAVEFPLGLVKLIGGIVWTVGEVIVLPFKALF